MVEKLKFKAPAALKKQKREPRLVPAKSKPTPQHEQTTQEWAEEYLSQRGSDLSLAKACGVILRTDETREGLDFRNYDPLTGRLQPGSRLRLRFERTIKGEKVKFLQSSNTESVPYCVSILPWPEIFGNVKIPLILSEGEPRALAGAKHGIIVISLGGVFNGFASASKCSELVPLLQKIKWKNRTVYLAFDADASGNKNVQRAQEKLAALLTARGGLVHIISLPRLTADGKTGLDDVLARPHGKELFDSLCSAAPLFEASKTQGEGRLIMRWLTEVTEKPVDYIWRGRIARGEITLLSGNPGEGKSFVTVKAAADFSCGRVPVTGEKCPVLRTLYVTNENDPEHVLHARFRLAGGDFRHFAVVEGAENADGNSTGISFADLTLVERAIEKNKIDLVVFDPLQSYFGSSADFHKASETRPLMDNVVRLAKKYNIGVVIIRHLSKASGGRAIHRGIGSIDFSACVRIEFIIGTCADEPNNRHMLTVQNKIGKPAPGLRFAIEDVKEKHADNAKLVWKGESKCTLGDLTAPEKTTQAQTGVTRAREFLKKQLAAGPRTLEYLLAAGDHELRMLQRAANRIGVHRDKPGPGKVVKWSLPGQKVEEKR